MASYQKIALFVLFDSIEQDLVKAIRTVSGGEPNLTAEEAAKAARNVGARSDSRLDPASPSDQLYGLDLYEKYQVLMRHKGRMDESTKQYYASIEQTLQSVLPVRNTVMHGRPLTVTQYGLGFAFAQSLLSRKTRWPLLAESYFQYSKEPEALVARSIQFLDTQIADIALNNLPIPDYDDTGFLPRPDLQRDLKHKLLGRNPVVTLLGDGGNGKTALALQTLYDLLDTNDHSFEAILWFSAKSAALGVRGIEQIGDAVTDGLALVELAADFNRGSEPPMERLRELLRANKILLAIDNLETVTGGELKALAEDVPGESKLLFTSRTPIGGDITVNVGEFTENESLSYLRTLSKAYGVRTLRGTPNDKLKHYASRLGYKPLLLKWLVLGVKSGLSPEAVIANPKVALKFCLENVMDKLRDEARAVVTVLATLSAPPSAIIISNVSGLSVAQTDEGISELARFGLIDAVESEGSERLFRLRPFTRSYVMRIVTPSADVTNEIRSRYARIESQYQIQKQQGRYNPYAGSNYVVRSTSEMVAANCLRQAVRAARDRKFDLAETIIQGLRITDPCYFEVYRAEAFVASSGGDVIRAINCYEEAFEHCSDQPHLHYFFAGLLMRASYYDRAKEEFEKAIALDGSSSAIYREAARNELYRFNFQEADDLLSKASEFSSKSDKERIVLSDLAIQVCIREIDFQIMSRNLSAAKEPLIKLRTRLEALEKNLIDYTMREHILNALPKLATLENQLDGCQDDIHAIRTWMRRFLRHDGGAVPRAEATDSATQGLKMGRLRSAGLKPNFGFLEDEASQEHVFVHRNSLSPEDWYKLTQGARAQFKVELGTDGKTKATDVSLVG